MRRLPSIQERYPLSRFSKVLQQLLNSLHFRLIAPRSACRNKDVKTPSKCHWEVKPCENSQTDLLLKDLTFLLVWDRYSSSFCSCILFLAAFGHPFHPFLQKARVQPLAERSPEPLRLARQCLVAPDVLHQEPPTEFAHHSTSLRRKESKNSPTSTPATFDLFYSYCSIPSDRWKGFWCVIWYVIDWYSQVGKAYFVLHATRMEDVHAPKTSLKWS